MMPSLFAPISFGNMRLKNRFVHCATYESMALESGEVTDQLTSRYRRLAKGKVGLLIAGFMHVHLLEKAFK